MPLSANKFLDLTCWEQLECDKEKLQLDKKGICSGESEIWGISNSDIGLIRAEHSNECQSPAALCSCDVNFAPAIRKSHLRSSGRRCVLKSQLRASMRRVVLHSHGVWSQIRH